MLPKDFSRRIDSYVLRLMADSSPKRTAWNMEKLRMGIPPNWNYIDGCMMFALQTLCDLTGDRRYGDFVYSYISSFVSEDGAVRTFEPEKHALDDYNEGRTLIPLWKSTGEEKFRRAADMLHSALADQPRTPEGNWWHKQIYPDQVWLDGIYMAQPFAAMYEKTFGDGDYSDIFRQVETVRQRMRDPKTGLYYHGYDASRKAFWCNPETGLSQSFWLRAIGWFSVALADLLEIIPPEIPGNPIPEIFSDLMRDILPFADPETGLYYQVVDRAEAEGNYQESSGSAMIAYAMLKGARLGILPETFAEKGRKTFEGLVEH